MKAQVAVLAGRRAALGLERPSSFTRYVLYRVIARLLLAERVARLSNPDFRAQLLAQPPEGGAGRPDGAVVAGCT